MSRNFELLQNLSKLPEVSQPEVEAQGSTAPPTGETLPLQMEGMQRGEISKLVSRLFIRSGAEAPRQVVFTGTESGTGCSWICARTAEVLAAAQGGASVCVVDANLCSPSLHKQFGVENDYGLSDALRQTDSIRKYARPVPVGKLALITAGSAADWQALLVSQQMRSRMVELRREFDYVLLDIPPVNLYTDGIMLGRMSDGLILVLKAHSSRREVACRVVEELRSSNVRLLGAILNARRLPIPEALYPYL
jgi:Mrp family chromosome partitioning ATPase